MREAGCVGPGAQLGSPLRDSVVAEPFWSGGWGAQPRLPAPRMLLMVNKEPPTRGLALAVCLGPGRGGQWLPCTCAAGDLLETPFFT